MYYHFKQQRVKVSSTTDRSNPIHTVSIGLIFLVGSILAYSQKQNTINLQQDVNNCIELAVCCVLYCSFMLMQVCRDPAFFWCL